MTLPIGSVAKTILNTNIVMAANSTLKDGSPGTAARMGTETLPPATTRRSRWRGPLATPSAATADRPSPPHPAGRGRDPWFRADRDRFGQRQCRCRRQPLDRRDDPGRHNFGNTITALTKVGGGSLILTATNTYSGATTSTAACSWRARPIPSRRSSNVFVGTNGTAGTLDLTATAFPQTVKSLTIGSSGASDVSIGDPLASLNNVTFGNGSTIYISGTIGATPQLLMTYGGTSSGTFTNVFDNGSSIPATDLNYSGGSIEVYDAAASFSGSGTWIGATGSWNTLPTGPTASTTAFPATGREGLAWTRPPSAVRASQAITLDINPNIAALSFSGANYTLSGTGTLTLQQGTLGTGTSTVTVTNGTQTIASAVEISGGSLAVLVSNSGSLAISGNITDDNGQRVVDARGDGTGQLVLSGNNTYGGGTNVQSGTLIVESPTALPNGSSLTVGAGASSLFGSSLIGSPIVSNLSAVSAGSGVSRFRNREHLLCSWQGWLPDSGLGGEKRS